MKYKLSDIKYYTPHLSECLLLVTIFLVVGNIGVSIILPLLYNIGIGELPQAGIYFLSMIPALWWIFYRSREYAQQEANYIVVDKPNFGKLSIPIVMALLVLAELGLSYIIEPLYMWIPIPEKIGIVFEEVFMNSNPIDLFISASILAPIFEEFLCRGTILRGLLYHYSPIKSILISAAIFAFIHMNPWQAIPAFIIGCFIGWIYYLTHSFWACVFLHVVNNTFAQVMRLVFPETGISDTFYNVLPRDSYFIIYLISVIVVISAIAIFNKYLSGNEKTISFKAKTNPEE